MATVATEPVDPQRPVQKKDRTHYLYVFVIAAVLAGALALHWYIQHRQIPYRWRDEGWGLERWRESRHEGDDEDDDEYGGSYWDDDDRRY